MFIKGAQYFHGAEENPLFEWFNDMKLLSDYENPIFGLQGYYCTSSGESIDPELIDYFLALITNIKLSLFKRASDDADNQYDSLGLEQQTPKSAREIFRQQFDIRLSQDPTSDHIQRAQLNDLFAWFLKYEAIENGCNDMDEVSLASYTDYSDFSDGAVLNLRWGYKTLLDWFSKQIPAEKVIYLNKQVINIDLRIAEDRNKTIVRFRDTRSKEEAQIECSSVIITSSIGYLKKHQDTLFTPPLPSPKKTIIETIGFGTVNKIFLQFEEAFWQYSHDIEPVGFKIVWPANERYLNRCSDFPIWARDLIGFDGVRRQPKILVGWIGGDGARLMEQESDSKIGETCLRILKKFLPCDQDKPDKLLSCVPTRWHSNPYSCGSYSFRSIKCLEQDMEELHRPVTYTSHDNKEDIPGLLFAGEATADDLYSTTHGAIISGWREAHRILETYLPEKDRPKT